MNRQARLLYLCDPLDTDAAFAAARQADAPAGLIALSFRLGEDYLSQARQAFVDAGCTFVAAEGYACPIALALSALMPVEKLALNRCIALDRRRIKAAPVSLRRVAAFARRNLSLSVAQIWISNSDPMEEKRLVGALNGCARIRRGVAGEGWLRDFLRAEG